MKILEINNPAKLTDRKPEKVEEEEPLSACPFCGHSIPDMQLLCTECKSTIPFCVASVCPAPLHLCFIYSLCYKLLVLVFSLLVTAFS